jgi:hypothetical protein
MKKLTRFLSQTWIPVIAGLLFLLLATSPPTFGGNDDSDEMVVESCGSAGNTVTVDVLNPSAQGRSGTVTVAARVEGNLVVQSASVSLRSSSRVSLTLSYSSDIEEIITVGLYEDPNPF